MKMKLVTMSFVVLGSMALAAAVSKMDSLPREGKSVTSETGSGKHYNKTSEERRKEHNETCREMVKSKGK